jgi:thiol-disulfide isomerase/thioredoxin
MAITRHPALLAGYNASLAFIFCKSVQQAVVHFTLYSRSYCHLCDDMLAALQALRHEFDFSVEVLDVDADPELVARYDELVPVLLGGKGGQEPARLCHYFLDEDKVRALLSA